MKKRPRLSNRVGATAALSLGCNALYGGYQGIMGLRSRSLWLVVLWAFYWILAALRACVLVCARTGEKEEKTVSQALVTRTAGVLLLLLACVLLWSVAMQGESQGSVHGEITMIAVAAYTFYKITAALVQAHRWGRHPPPLGKVLGKVGLAEGAASLLTLQRSMLATFGGDSFPLADRMNRWTGGGVCLLILVLGMTTTGQERKETIMAKSKLVKTNETIERKVTTAFGKIQDTVTGGYHWIENAFVDRYLTREGETVEEAKNRLKEETGEQK